MLKTGTGESLLKYCVASSDTSGSKLFERFVRGEQIIAYGACSPLNALLLHRLGHYDLWLSSLEISAFFGERDDESVSRDDLVWLLSRIKRKCPTSNIILDCDSGWETDDTTLRQTFAKLSSYIGMGIVENIRPGQKENSFLRVRPEDLLSPETVAERLTAIRQSMPGVVIGLRLENLIAGETPQSVGLYIQELVDLKAPVDLIVVHNTSPSPAPIIEVGKYAHEVGIHIPLGAITTAYAQWPNLLAELKGAGFRLVIIPNYAVRYSTAICQKVYSDLVQGRLIDVDKSAPKMADLFSLIYGTPGMEP